MSAGNGVDAAARIEALEEWKDSVDDRLFPELAQLLEGQRRTETALSRLNSLATTVANKIAVVSKQADRNGDEIVKLTRAVTAARVLAEEAKQSAASGLGEMRAKFDSLSEYEPTSDDDGNVRMSGGQFDALRETLTNLRQEIAVKEARAKGAEEEREKTETAANKRSERLSNWIAAGTPVAVAVGAGVAWLLMHVFHL